MSWYTLRIEQDIYTYMKVYMRFFWDFIMLTLYGNSMGQFMGQFMGQYIAISWKSPHSPPAPTGSDRLELESDSADSPVIIIELECQFSRVIIIDLSWSQAGSHPLHLTAPILPSWPSEKQSKLQPPTTNKAKKSNLYFR